jgi:hypothetical protein
MTAGSRSAIRHRGSGRNYFVESHTGEHHLTRPPRKRAGVGKKRGLRSEQIPVLMARDS